MDRGPSRRDLEPAPSETGSRECARSSPPRYRTVRSLHAKHGRSNQQGNALLFGVRAGQPVLLNAAAPTSDVILSKLRSYLEREPTADDLITRTAAAGPLEAAASDLETPGLAPAFEIDGQAYTPMLLRASGARIVGVALLRAGSEELGGSYQNFLPNLANALLAFGDVDPLR